MKHYLENVDTYVAERISLKTSGMEGNHHMMRKMTVVHPGTHATTLKHDKCQRWAWQGNYIKIHLITQLIMCPFHRVPS